MTAVIVDYAALGLDAEFVTPEVTPNLSRLVTAEVRNAIYDTPEVQAIVESVIKEYLKGLSLTVTYMGREVTLSDAVEVAKFYGDLNKDYRKAYHALIGNDTYKSEQARLFRAEIEALKDQILSWARENNLNTQRGNAQTKDGAGFVALRHVVL